MLSVLAFGFLLGMRHATDPDHVVAVSTLVARTKRLGGAWLLGACWGLGHTVTLFLVGMAIVAFKVTIPARLGLGMEAAVGVMLVVLGAMNMAGYSLGSLGVPTHDHRHDHKDPEHRHETWEEHEAKGPHAHPHAHEFRFDWLDDLLGEAGPFQVLRAGVVGLVHGLAGSAAVALLVLATIHGTREAALYLLVFGVGTLAGMLLLSSLMELSMVLAVRRWLGADRALTFATGLLSAAFGLWVTAHSLSLALSPQGRGLG